ncbi:unnamed protein product [Adineta ricciae]|uniref:F-box domain-containing protein n=1 Tax=Adineta ricciae TaxID=249248 RepID=A0A814GEB6_ADIRI|nr:unnamed protein product [Adineta ricciae]CAF1285001.1 unnamed protein product [Adineta ricciae]
MSLTKFEWIPNEVLLEIFEFLSPVDIFQGFYYLNKRYNEFLQSLHIRADLVNLRKRTYDYYNYFLFPLMSQRIIALRCEDIFDRLMYQIRLSEFPALKYLTIDKLQFQTLQKILPQINLLQKLVYLNLQIQSDHIREEMITFRGQLPLLQTCIFDLNTQLSIENDQPYSQLTNLVLNQCHIEQLCSFVHFYTPQLQQLTVTLANGKIPESCYVIPHLKSLVVYTNEVSFANLVKSMLSSVPNLQLLTIDATDIDYANGKSWESVLSTHLRKLIHLRLNVRFSENDLPAINDRKELLQTFDTSYFRSRYWSFALHHCRTKRTLELFSTPMVKKSIEFNLYNTNVEKPMTDADEMFENVENLTLFLTILDESLLRERFHFPNVKSLKLVSHFQECQAFPKSLLADMAHLVKLSNVESIEFIGNHFPTSSLILLDYTPKLHSLSVRLSSIIKMTKMLTDQNICQRLTKLIRHLTITAINNLKDLSFYERLPTVFAHLDSLTLSCENLDDLYLLITLLLSKMASKLRTMKLCISPFYDKKNLDQFMSWLIDYMYQRDLSHVDIQLSNNQISFCF